MRRRRAVQLPAPRRVPVLIAVVVATGLLLAAIVRLVDTRSVHFAGSNRVPATLFTRVVHSHGTFCQADEDVPARTAGVMVTAGTYGKPGPALGLVISQGGRIVGEGRLPAGWREGSIALSLRRPTINEVPGARVCIQNEGRARFALAGYAGQVRFAYPRPGLESWWALRSVLQTRFGLGKADWYGGWALPVALLLVLAAAAIALITVVRTPS